MSNVSDFLVNTALILVMYICLILLGMYTFILLQHIFGIDCSNILNIMGATNGEV